MTEISILLAELNGHRYERYPKIEFGFSDSIFSTAIEHLPLLHRLNGQLSNANEIICNGVPLVLQVAAPKGARAAIGKDQRLFLSFGVAAYQDPQIVLVLGPVTGLRTGRESTPWDSRGSQLSGDLVAHYTLQAPDDEVYLALHLSTCFASLASFLDGQAPVRIDPQFVFRRQVYDGAPPAPELHTPEATLSEPLAIDLQSLRAVFVNSDQLGEKWSSTLLALKRVAQRCRVPYISNPGPGGVRASVAQFTKDRLHEVGVSC